MRKVVLLAVLALSLGTGVRADTITQVANWLEQNATGPLTISDADRLAANLLIAQATTPYAQLEADSLLLSEESVERALGISWAIALLQSGIAIDDRVTVSLSPTSLNFGTVPIVNSPELSAFDGLLIGLVLNMWLGMLLPRPD